MTYGDRSTRIYNHILGQGDDHLCKTVGSINVETGRQSKVVIELGECCAQLANHDELEVQPPLELSCPVHGARSKVLRLYSYVEISEYAFEGSLSFMFLLHSEGELGEVGECPGSVSLLVIFVWCQDRHAGRRGSRYCVNRGKGLNEEMRSLRRGGSRYGSRGRLSIYLIHLDGLGARVLEWPGYSEVGWKRLEDRWRVVGRSRPGWVVAQMVSRPARRGGGWLGGRSEAVDILELGAGSSSVGQDGERDGEASGLYF